MLENQYGHFDPSGKIYAITDSRTPTPWVNVVCNGRYGFVVSQNGGGFSWLDNSQQNVLTRWDMDLGRDERGRYLYLSDLDSGQVWSVAPAPCFAEYESYRCEHTMGRTTFRTSAHGIASVWTLAVAPKDPVEVWTVELTNASGARRRIRIASFFEWCCGVAPDVKREFHRLFFTTRHDTARRAIVATKNMWDVPPRHEREHWNRPWPYAAAHAVGGITFDHPVACGDKLQFMGRYQPPSRPELMTAESPKVGGFGRFADASAALGGDLVLEPGQSVRLHYLLAIAPSEAEVLALIDRYNTPEAAASACGGAEELWSAITAPSQVSTDRPDFDLLNNWWLPYQAISGRLWGRTGYYQQSGAFGFRDQLQDSQVWLTRDPARCREQILLHAAHQFVDGTVYHWWHPLTEFGNHTTCSDDYLWLPFVTANYIKETGDVALLSERTRFVDDAGLDTVLEHCRRSFERSFARFSPRGLPLIGSCDWNDGLSAVGIEGRGESVWLAMFLVGLLGDWAEMLERIGEPSWAASYIDRRDKLVAAINAHAWDGAWYRGASKDDGTWLGSRANEAGKIFLNTQTWAVLTGCAPKDREDAAWASVKEHLLADMGPLLLSPAYTEPDASVGYITRYSPGSRENGGVYMHAATWALAAACKRRDRESVAQIWRAISPPTRGTDAEAYRAEPYVMPGNVDGPLSELPGRAGWTWYTGSAAWLNRVSLEWMLGVRPSFDGLVIDPCPPAEFGAVELTRLWRGRTIRIRFDAATFVAGTAPTVTLNGRAVEGGILKHKDLPENGTAEVHVSWGPTVEIRTRGQVGAVRETSR